ncbi:hypothetical protein TKK_0017407 [Trichogramma kaykai]
MTGLAFFGLAVVPSLIINRLNCCSGFGLILLLLQLFASCQANPLPSNFHHVSLGANVPSEHWETSWLMYGISLLGITTTTFTLVGCLCCRRKRPKGFKENSEGSVNNKEFKDACTIENDASLPQMQGLELQVPISTSLNECVQFEPIAVERIVPESLLGNSSSGHSHSGLTPSPRPKPPPALQQQDNTDCDSESDASTLKDSCHEWFQKTDLHVPRDKLKYLREIGHGWFGKVVEGCADIQALHQNKSPVVGGAVNNLGSNVVVRILTEEATAREKAWFLGEATPYFKLRHRNILSLFGSCLESDPYLLLFEACPLGDLKGFLRTNRDLQSRQALVNENMPTRIAIEVAAGLRHMHEHGLTHTDLASRNCLVASDLSIKVGDYGLGVEKYPADYYVLGDRALPIRWTAPETIECTETTVQTREITVRANVWSYAVLLWEIARWGERPYDDLGDEKVIESLLSSSRTPADKLATARTLLDNCQGCASNLIEAIDACLVLEPEKRLPLERVRHVLLREQLESESSDFEQRWETLRPNTAPQTPFHQQLQQQQQQPRSASLQNLRGSLDSEQWPSFTQTLTSFRLGPEEPVKNVPRSLRLPFRESDSETEEESWRGRVERGAYTEKVKQKSKSVADLMVLVHIEPESDADLSLGPQISMSDKASLCKKRLPVTGSDGDLPSAVFDDQFDWALKKLRDPLSIGNSLRVPRSLISADRPKLLTLTTDHGQTPILRLAVDSKDENIAHEVTEETSTVQASNVSSSPTHVLTLFPKDDTNQSLLRYNDEASETPASGGAIAEPAPLSDIEKSQSTLADITEPSEDDVPPHLAKNIQVTDLDEESDAEQTVVVNKPRVQEENNKWNEALTTALEQKTVAPSASITTTPTHKNEATNEETITPSPQSRAEYSAGDVEDEFSNAEDLPGLSKHQLPMDEEDDRKRMSTPDDERSSDSGFRDKESCEEEESPLPGPLPKLDSVSQPDNAEEEQLRILLELDTILDAECYGTLGESLEHHQQQQQQTLDTSASSEISSNSSKNPSDKPDIETETESSDTVQSSSEATVITERENIQIDKSASDDTNVSCCVLLDSQPILDSDSTSGGAGATNAGSDEINNTQANLEDEDSSTMSMRSDNSYVSFAMDEEFVAAIRNELREKLPQAQTSIVEQQDPRDDDDPSLVGDVDNRNWDDEDELGDRSGTIDISIRYNSFGTPLSPIMEERENSNNSDSTNNKDESQDASTASKGNGSSISEDDVLLIDTQTNRATLVEGVPALAHDTEELSNCNDRENTESHPQVTPQHQRFGGIVSGLCTGAPMPSPEEEGNLWHTNHQLNNLSTQLEDNLMSTSFASENWDSEDDEPGSESLANDPDHTRDDNDDDDDDDDDDDEGEDGPMDEEDEEKDDNSSSSGEFVWMEFNQRDGNEHDSPSVKKSTRDDDATNDMEEDSESDGDEEDEEDEEEEFTPSAWDATLAPHRSALRSPDKSQRTGDQKKSVWFKKQRYHCVYEYPKETPPMENSPAVPYWEATSYSDWEELINNMDRLNFQPMDYFESSNTRAGAEEEFFVSSSNRPFQFQPKFASQFFPGASGSSQDKNSTQEQQQQTPRPEESPFTSDRQQLGELRHTRDRLTLNFGLANGNRILPLCNPVRHHHAIFNDDEEEEENGNEVTKTTTITEQPQQQPSTENSAIIQTSVKTSPSDGPALPSAASLQESKSNSRDDLQSD